MSLEQLDMLEAPRPRLAERIRAADPEAIEFFVAGEPVGKAARVARNGFAFLPKRTAQYMETLRRYAQEAMGERVPLDCAVRVDLVAVMPIPASWSKKKQQRAISGEVRPTSKPDLSNIAKGVEDSLNKIVVRDDALIVEYGELKKVYGERPGITIRVVPVGGGA